MTGETARAQAALEKRIIKRKERDEEAQNVAYVAADPGNIHDQFSLRQGQGEEVHIGERCEHLSW